MPEGPELHLASIFVNRMCSGVVFTGPVQKSEVSKNLEVPFSCKAYTITASSRGKEVCLTLTSQKSDPTLGGSRRPKTGQVDQVQPQTMNVVFRFGMSGYFRFTVEEELPKHAHLQFYTNEKPCRVLSFVDPRRFGSWQPNGTWQAARGPCVMFQYQSFRENVLSHLSDRVFDRPICEVLLNQKYFNGIGNYLRAEILFRSNIPPFVMARTVLEGLKSKDEPEEKKNLVELSSKVAVKTKVKKEEKMEVNLEEEAENPDLLRLCNLVPLEVIKLGGKGYDPEKNDYSGFKMWLRCYEVDGMRSIRDHNGRTMWFMGAPGPMTPKGSKSPKAKKRLKEDPDVKHRIIKKTSTVIQTKPKAIRNEKEGRRKYVSRQEVRGTPRRPGQSRASCSAEAPRRRSGRVSQNTPS
ncbi:hypothetical protein UPYG_G00273470 [Umbra pygmaea]|uniref:Formamidopyrimidine-DNA glycosylase catalytic domain-containing protein n=1 Tax=Umbra pygmaea TaxID=75934 RepID=A0ABD0WB97_UMBPY